ncbi:MAG: ABC transporter ATP-binding protein [Sandaracinus sp.]|nr:ABC transporter ATP-binding protein [Sandaracinus sp.]
MPALDELDEAAAAMYEDGVEGLDAVARAARDRGLDARVFAAPLGAVLTSLDGRPVLIRDGRGSLVALEARTRARVAVRSASGEREWVSREELIERLMLRSESEEARFVSLDERPDPGVGHPGKHSPWRLVGDLLRPEKPDIGVVVIYAVGIGLLSLTLPIAVQVLVNTVAFGTLLQPILVLSALVGAGLVFAAGLRALQTWVVEVIQRRMFVRMTSALAERLPRVEITAFETGRGPDLMNRFFDIFTAQKATSVILVEGFEALLTSFVGLLVLAFYHPLLLGFGAALILAVVFVVFVMGRNAAQTSVDESYAKYAVAGWLEEMVRHLFVLKTTGGAEMAASRLDGLAATWLRSRDVHFRIFFRQFIGTLAIQVLVSVALLAVGGWLVVERELTIGQLVAAELIVSAVVASISKLGTKLETMYDLVAAADKLGTLLSLPVERSHGERALPPSGPLAVRLESVRSHSGVLHGTSLNIPAGSAVLLRADAHKRAALVDLLFALEEPEEGVVRVGGEDLRDIDLTSARARTAVVRDAEIIPGTIAENVRIFAPQLTASEVWAVLDSVGLADVVRALPEGLRTQLPPSGLPLEPLDRIRLTLARAVAARPGLLVMDGVLSRFPLSDARELARQLADERTLLMLDHVETPDPEVPGLVQRGMAA